MYNSANDQLQVTDTVNSTQNGVNPDYIVNPVTHRPVKLLSPKGREILRQYLVQYGQYLDCLTSHK